MLRVLPGARSHTATVAVVPESGGTGRSAPISPDAPGSPPVESLLVLDDETADAWGIDARVVALVADFDEVVVTHQWWFGGPVERAVLVDADGAAVGEVPAEHATTWRVPFGGIVSPATADRLGLELVPGPTVVRTPAPLTDAQRDELAWTSDELNELGLTGPAGEPVWLWAETEWQPFDVPTAVLLAAITALAALLSLLVIGLGLALSAAETKDERDVLATVGARPRSRRRLAATKAAVLATVGTTLGVPIGFAAAWVVIRAATLDRHVGVHAVLPWQLVLLLVLAVPLVATLATLATRAAALRLRPVRASTMAFD